MREIQLTRGQVALVDDWDYEWLNQWKWQAHRSKSGNWYANRTDGGWGRKKTFIAMHRLLMPGVVRVDHIDMNGLNNRRSNLRAATNQGNSANSRKMPGCSSKFKGVHRHCGKWHARIRVNYQSIFLGGFDLEEDAARAYDVAARKHFGEFARPNFPL